MVFFAFHQYLDPNFLLNIFFCWEIYFCSICYLEWCINTSCFKYITSYPCFYFLWMFMLCKKEATIFHIYGRKSFTKSHLTKVQPSFYKIFEKFNDDLYLWKSEVTTINKGKIFNISLNMHIFLFFFLTKPCAIHFVTLMVFLYLALNLETCFKKCYFLQNFILSFLFE